MSHFTVLVFAENEQELDTRLAPFNEQDDKYMVFEDHTDDAKVEYETGGYDSGHGEHHEFRRDYATFEAFCSDWKGYRQADSGRWGWFCNPNAKWDWWVIGGRWPDILAGKDVAIVRRVLTMRGKNNGLPTFALLDSAGVWHERGEMGWWACVSNEKPRDEWSVEFWKIIEAEAEKNPEQRVYVTDCHI